MNRAGWTFARHIFHRRCPHCYQEGYQKGYQTGRDAELRAVAKTPDEERWARYEQWLREAS